MLSVTILNRDKRQIEHSLIVTVDRFDAYANGGPYTAQLRASGTNEALGALRRWLGYYVVIHNENNTPVWWGKITEIPSTRSNGLGVGCTLENMYNAVKVLYSTLGGDGYPVPQATDYAEHARSIAVYGRKEWHYSAGQTTSDTADALADALLDRFALAPQSLALSAPDVATIRCKGLWFLMDWTYYSNGAGREVYEGFSNAEQIVGWGVTATDIGFADRGIQRISGVLDGPVDGDKIRVSGSTSNDGLYTITGVTGQTTTYTATTISFEAADDILDSAEGLGFARLGSFIRVSGSTNNSRSHLIDDVGRSAIATATGTTGTIVAESAGPSITIEQGQTIDVITDLTLEIPGDTVTLSGPSKLAYSFTVTENYTWVLSEIAIRVRREGAPADNLQVSLYSSTGTAPNALLASATITGTALPSRLEWVSASFDHTVAMTYGTAYWIVIERTGSNSTQNYYLVGLDEDANHSGLLKLWDGTAWIDRSVNASMPFQAYGHSKTTDQIEDILATEGQFLNGYDVRVDSGLYRREYRSGDLTSLTELEDLLNDGTNTGSTLLAMITSDWRCVVSAAPSSAGAPYKWNGSRLTTVHGTAVGDGVLPVGQWCIIDGLDSDSDALAPLSPMMIGYMEWSAGKISDLQTFGTRSVWDIPTLLQG